MEVRKKMIKKIIGCFIICILMISAILPLSSIAGDPDDPEIKDRRFDVKVFGIFGFFFQSFLKHIDVVSAWFDEDSENPDYLTVCLKTRALMERTETLEAIYKVNWFYNHEEYGVILKIHTDGIFAGFLAYKDLGQDRHEMHPCEGIYDIEQGVITWKVSKGDIGNLGPGSLLTTTSATALLRPWDETTGKPGPDIFKDLSIRLIGVSAEERYGENYQIKY
jgi:hypothetical protein